MILSGRFIEEKHKELFIRKCPRPIREPYTKCLHNIWKELIDDLQDIEQDLEKVIRGRKGNREVDPLLLNDILQDLEVKVRERLLESKKGIDFLKREGINGLKMVVYCVLNCGKLVNDFYKKSGRLGEKRVLLLHELLIYYYLRGDTQVTHSTIQEYEKIIENRKKLKKEGRLKKRDYEDISILEDEEYETNNDDEDNFLDAWDGFTRKNEQPIVEKIEQREELEDKIESIEENILDIEIPEVIFFDFTKIFEGDPILTKIIQSVCSTTDKHDFTCDVNSEIYSLVKVKLIHAFLQRTELFNDIDFTAECLHDGKFNIKQLRHTVKLYLRKYTKEELTPEILDKFLLCSICHLIRELTALSKFDQIDGLEVFFKYQGEIFKIDKKTLEEKKRRGLKLLQEEKKAESDKQLSQEKIIHHPLPDSEKIEDAKKIFEIVAATIDYDKLTPEEIVDKRSIAKSLLGITEEDNTQWIGNIPKVWKKETELQQFLALEILDGIDGLSNKENSVIRHEEKSSEKSVINDEQIKQYKIKCDECKKTIDFDVCGKNSKIVLDNINRSKKDVQQLWIEREDLRPCIANELLRK